jgi:hypothetical protein
VISSCTEIAMIEDNDRETSAAVKRVSHVEELQVRVSERSKQTENDALHPKKVLHHELVNSFGRVGHVDFPISFSEIRLSRR